jgi:hypothetical protein
MHKVGTPYCNTITLTAAVVGLGSGNLIAIEAEHKKADRRRQIGVLPVCVDDGDQI